MATKKKKYTPVARTIYLTDYSGTIDYGGNDQLTAVPTDTLSWTSSTHAISVVFPKGKSPFKPATLILTANKGSATPPTTVKKPLVRPKKYKYIATISDGNTIIVEDPIIIVDDDGGGGGGKGKGKGKGRTPKKRPAKK